MLGVAIRSGVCVLLLALAPIASAQDTQPSAGGAEDPVDKRPGARGPDQQPGITEVHAEGEYGGVVPGRVQGQTPQKPQKPKKAKKRTPTVSWVGYQPLEGGAARVFVQANAALTYDQKVVGDELVVTLPGVKLNTRNNARPLDTTYFDSRVASVSAKVVKRRGKRQPGGVEVRVKFKKGGAMPADAHVETGPDGATYLYLDFGP